MTINVGIYLFPQVEVLDFAGPYEVFTTAARVAARRQPAGAPPFAVFTIAENRQPCPARAGLLVLPDHAMADHPAIDLLLVPGGVVTAELAKPAVIDWLRTTAARASLTASVCTGAFLLAQAGLLAGKRATTHWEDLADLARDFPDLTVIADALWVDEGNLVTAAGIAAGIAMSLHLVARLNHVELAAATARQMEYPWEPAQAGNCTRPSASSGKKGL